MTPSNAAQETTSNFWCENHKCVHRGRLKELPWRDVDHYPFCPECGDVMRENVRAPNVIWTGAITKRYRDPKLDGYQDRDGIRAYSRKTPDGKPKLVELEDWGQVKQFCKQEGLADPRSTPLNFEVGDDGKTVKNTRGMPGTEL